MIYRGRADNVRLDSDESGWNLVIDTADGDTFVLNIHGCAFGFAASKGLAELLAWHSEGEQVRREVVAHRPWMHFGRDL